MKYKIKNIIRGIKNLWKWRKTIYYDRDWDYWYIYEMLKVKLKFNAEYAEKYGYHENSINDAHMMRYIADLIDKVQSESYIDQSLMDKFTTNHRIDEAVTKHNLCRKEIFKLMEENIESWWE
jgi:hypothetical protein